MEATFLIRLKDIRKSYRDGGIRLNQVLKGVSVDVEAGEFVAINGASGSGKTTLLSILGTLLLPDAGSYLLNGKEVFAPGVNHSAVRNKQIGFVFQDHRLMPQLTALENILLPTLAYRSRALPEEYAYALRLMELTGLSAVARRYPHTLSGGEASRAAVCRALIMKPALLLADEPTGQLDAENARNITSLLAEIHETLHTTIVMVTHSEETSAVAGRVLTLQEGILR
jgi:ABC-type lipoprotein export system ATPase subunit